MLLFRAIKPTPCIRGISTSRSVSSTARRRASGVYDAVPPPGSSNANSEEPPPANTSAESRSSSSSPSPTYPGPEIPPPPIDPGPSPAEALSSVPTTTAQARPDREDMTHVIPFNTYEFYKALEQTFDPPVARTLMRATREMLIGRIRKTTGETLHVKDFDNGAYLFKAALSELRTELTLRTRKETATQRTSLNALRKEVDILDGKMKEDIANLKHEPSAHYP
ncbi:hypothetical protein FRB90_005347 [Tulasnella sp. 427]|nr:hypothetical protein FRB90_005347 [Tulasnella sp. 427]